MTMVSDRQLRSKLRRSDIFVAPSAFDSQAQLRRSGIGPRQSRTAPLGLKQGFAAHRFYKDSAPTELAWAEPPKQATAAESQVEAVLAESKFPEGIEQSSG